jgi:type III pantothenate kinase
MRSGVYWGYVGLIEGLVRRMQEEFGSPMTVVATGGLAPLFAEATGVIQHLDYDLTLRGLLQIYRLNRPS